MAINNQNTNQYYASAPDLSQGYVNNPYYSPNTMPANASNNVQPQPVNIPCRYVQNEQSIIAQEVPMNNQYGVFVQYDMDMIYLKRWQNDGSIDTKYYKEIKPNGQEPQMQDPVALILSRLDNIEKQLKRRNGKPKQYKDNRKVVDENAIHE